MNIGRLDWLHRRLSERMAELGESPNLARVMEPGFADARLYAIYLIETYHYTKHNSRNQALVAADRDGLDPRYAKFCLKHALEETGHEFMALHDLKAMGVDIGGNPPPLAPLAETQVLIAYLYWVASQGNPLARLGYSYWAERSYEFIRPLLNWIGSGMGVEAKAMTFFNEHADIDVSHAREVDETILRFARSEADWRAIEEVMLTSLDLTARMLDAVFEEFVQLKSGGPTRYAFLTPLAAAG